MLQGRHPQRVPERYVLADALEQFQAIQALHHQVGEDEVGLESTARRSSCSAVGSDSHLLAALSKHRRWTY
jgi:hypothetical protein